MPLPDRDTLVAYPAGDVSSTGTVLHVERLADGRSAVVLDRTALHPVDTAWPDQPADRAALRWGDDERVVQDGVTGGIHQGVLHLGADLPVRNGTEGWTFVVAHVIEGAPPAVGTTVEVEVDAAYRRSLSAGHTGCHLASLALDAALAAAWSKPVALDALGHPAFDQLAIQRSQIVPDGSLDTYRVGRSLRRKGFDPAALDDPGAVAERANALLTTWVTAGGDVRIERTDDALSARRRWVCALPDGPVSIPCGGTHVESLSALGSVTVALTTRPVDGGLELEMRTQVTPAR
ncbi:metal-dependent hydrolase [Microbacterium sp. PA5]|uniref:metal-dependent hydrolase n=1 Tax=Microbacterium sp. PA5 TaxID=3416654 RepID=UPI003CEEDF31